MKKEKRKHKGRKATCLILLYVTKVSPTNGTIQAFQQVVVGVRFTAVKPLTVKKTLRIEANDVESGSTVQTESVVVSAESYNALIDVCLFFFCFFSLFSLAVRVCFVCLLAIVPY